MLQQSSRSFFHLGMMLACGLTHVSAQAADGPWLLPPGVHAGSETAQGAIPIAAALQEAGQTQRAPDVYAAGSAYAALTTAYRNEKGGRLERVTSLYLAVGGVQPLNHYVTADATGVIIGGIALQATGWGGTNLLDPLFNRPGLQIATPGRAGSHKVTILRVRGAATETTNESAQALAFFEVLPSVPFKPGQKPLTTLAVRIRYQPDGWARIQLRLGEPYFFEQAGIAPFYPRQQTDGRTEHLSVLGAEVTPAPLGAWRGQVDATAFPGVAWYGTGGLGGHLATFALFNATQVTDLRTGQWGDGLHLVQWKTGGSELDLLVRTSQSFTVAELTAFTAAGPTLRKRLAEPFPPLNKTATDLYLSQVRRTFIESMISDSPAMVAMPKPGKKKKPDALFAPGVVERATQRLSESLESYDKLLAVLIGAKPGTEAQAAEEDVLMARTFLDDAFLGLAKYWSESGGFER